MDAAMTLYRLSWESVSAIQHPQFYDFRTERVRRGIDPATVPDEFWHETAVETTSPWEQRNGLHQLIREGELIRNVRLAKAVVTTSEWEPVEPRRPGRDAVRGVPDVRRGVPRRGLVVLMGHRSYTPQRAPMRLDGGAAPATANRGHAEAGAAARAADGTVEA